MVNWNILLERREPKDATEFPRNQEMRILCSIFREKIKSTKMHDLYY